MDEQQQHEHDDIPMVDAAPEPAAPNQLNPAAVSSIQRFSIVDVLGEDTTAGGMAAQIAKEIVAPSPDPMHSEMYEFDEGKVLHRLQQLYPHTDIQKLPRIWSKLDRWTMPVQNNNGVAQITQILELSTDFLRVTKHKGNSQDSKDAAAVRANRPIPRSCVVYYFEITVVSKGKSGYMGVGLSEKNVSLNRLPGWDQTSYGYHGDDGNFFASSGKGVEYGPTFTTGDVVGCGLNFVTREIFFTKNGLNLGVANSQPIPLNNELFPTIGMQTADEMIDANFGQRPFVYDIRVELEAAEAATLSGITSIELPTEKVLWMNSLISNWMAHEGYSRSLEALNRATGGTKLEPVPSGLAKSESQGSSTMTSAESKDSQSPTAAAEKVAENVMRSMIGILRGDSEPAGRRSVVRSVQEALHEEMEHRRELVRMVKRGEIADAIERVEQLYPNLLDSNRQLALLLKTQQFVEMLKEVSKDLPPLPQEHQQNHPMDELRPTSSHFSAISTAVHSPSPRPSSSRGGKRSAAAVEEEDAIAGTSADNGAAGSSSRMHLHHHNPVKRRSSDEECTERHQLYHHPHRPHHHHPHQHLPSPNTRHHHQQFRQQSQNGNSSTINAGNSTPRRQEEHHQNQRQQQYEEEEEEEEGEIGVEEDEEDEDDDEYMEISEESQDGHSEMRDDGNEDDENDEDEDDDSGGGNSNNPMLMLETMANGGQRSTNGCCSGSNSNNNNMLLVGTPPTSTTIIDEPVAEILEMAPDGMTMEYMEEQQEGPDYGGFESAEEQNQFARYAAILMFGQQISQLSLKLDGDDGQQPPQNCAALRQRMNEVFSLLCYRDPTQSDHAYLLEQSQRDMIAKALNAAILESHGKDGSSPLDKCLRRSRLIREQALATSASAVFADANRLLFGENPAASPSQHGNELNGEIKAEGKQGGTQESRGGKQIPKLIQMDDDVQKKEM